MSNERFELRPDALVVGPDGALGWLDAVLATPGTGQVSGFVLREGLLFHRGVRVPIEAVERTEDSRVHIWLSATQVNDLADMQARQFAESTPPDERRIEARRRVVGKDGEVGSLALVIVDPTSDRATHLVIRRGDVLDRETIVPMAWVRELTGNPIVLEARQGEIESLPEYRADEEITDAVSSLLWYRSNTHPDDLRYVRVRTHDGIVYLSGKTRTEQARLSIEEHARGVSGVLGVRNEIRTFEALAAAARALRQPGGPAVGAMTHTLDPTLLSSDGGSPVHVGAARPDEAATGPGADASVAVAHRIAA